jgi:acyl-CoA synthetase (AMP-forming)/AMP-acid ligase II
LDAEELHAFVRDNSINFAYLPSLVGKALITRTDLGALSTLVLGGEFPGVMYPGREGLSVIYVHDACGFPALSMNLEGVDPGKGLVPKGKPVPGVAAFVMGDDGKVLPKNALGRLMFFGKQLESPEPFFFVPERILTPEEKYLYDNGELEGYELPHGPSLNTEHYINEGIGVAIENREVVPERLYDTGEWGFLDSEGSIVPLGKGLLPFLSGKAIAPTLLERRVFPEFFLKNFHMGLSKLEDNSKLLSMWLFSTLASGKTPEAAKELERCRLGFLRALPLDLIPSQLIPLTGAPLDANGNLDVSRLPQRLKPRVDIAKNGEGLEEPSPIDSEEDRRGLQDMQTDLKDFWELHLKGPFDPDKSFREGGLSHDLAFLQSEYLGYRGRPVSVREIYAYPTPDLLSRNMLKHMSYSRSFRESASGPQANMGADPPSQSSTVTAAGSVDARDILSGDALTDASGETQDLGSALKESPGDKFEKVHLYRGDDPDSNLDITSLETPKLSPDEILFLDEPGYGGSVPGGSEESLGERAADSELDPPPASEEYASNLNDNDKTFAEEVPNKDILSTTEEKEPSILELTDKEPLDKEPLAKEPRDKEPLAKELKDASSVPLELSLDSFPLTALQVDAAYRAQAQGEIRDMGLIAVELEAPPSVESLEEALKQLTATHPMLLTVLSPDAPLQGSLTGEPPALVLMDDAFSSKDKILDAMVARALKLLNSKNGRSRIYSGPLIYLLMGQAEKTVLSLAYSLFALKRRDAIGFLEAMLSRVYGTEVLLSNPEDASEPIAETELEEKARLKRLSLYLSFWRPYGVPLGASSATIPKRLKYDLSFTKDVLASSKNLGVSPGAFLMASWALHLCLSHDQDQAGFACLTINDSGEHLCLPMRLMVDGSMDFRYLVTAAQGLMDTEKLGIPPLNELFKTLGLKGPARSYLNHMVTLNCDRDESGLKGGKVSALYERVSASYALILHLTCDPETEASPWGYLEVEGEVMDEEALEATAKGFMGIVQEAALNPDKNLDAFTLLKLSDPSPAVVEEGEKARVPSDYALREDSTPLFEQIKRAEELHGNNAFVTCGTERLSYSELMKQAQDLSGFFADMGPGMIGAVLFSPGIAQLSAILALIMKGAAALPLDPLEGSESLNLIISEAAPQLMISGSDIIGLTSFYEGPKVVVRPSGGASPFPGHSPEALEIDPESAFINFPGKRATEATLISRRALMVSARWHGDFFKWDTTSRVMVAPVTTALGLSQFLGAFISGAQSYLHTAETLREALALRDFLDNKRISHAHLPSERSKELLKLTHPTSLRFLTTQGLRADTQAQMEIHNFYVPLGASGPALMERISKESAPKSLGPVPGVKVSVIGREGGLRPDLYIGEIAFSSPMGISGFLKAPVEAEENRIVADPSNVGDAISGVRLIRTGDLGKKHPDGSLEYLGRAGEHLNLSGFAPKLMEVEFKIKSFPGVFEARVLLRSAGSKERALFAYIVRDGWETKERIPKKSEILDTSGDGAMDFDIFDIPEIEEDPLVPLETVDLEDLSPNYVELDDISPDYVDPETEELDKIKIPPDANPFRDVVVVGPEHIALPEEGELPFRGSGPKDSMSDSQFAKALHIYLKNELPWPLIPRFLIIVDYLPVNSKGHLDLSSLPRGLGELSQVEGPRSLSELMVQNALEDVLKTKGPRLDLGFLAMGGDSLMALMLSESLRGTVGMSPPPEEILNSQSAREMAFRLELILEESGVGLFQVRKGESPALALSPGPCGSLMCMRGLVEGIRGGRGCVCLNPFLHLDGGLTHKDPALITRRAEDYAKALARHFPDGDFILCGLGFMAPLSLLVAKIYEGLRGKAFSALLAIDSFSPGEEPGAEEDILEALPLYEGFKPKKREGRRELAQLELKTWRALKPEPILSPILSVRPTVNLNIAIVPGGAVRTPLSAFTTGRFREESLECDHFSLARGESAGKILQLLEEFLSK